MRHVDHRSDAEEIVNLVFQVAWQKLDKVPDPPNTRKWLLWVARRTISNHTRSTIRQWKLLNRLSSLRTPSAIELNIDDSEGHDTLPIRRAFNSLRDSEKAVLQLIVWDELSHTEAAVVLQCTVKTFDVRLHRARVALRTALELEDSRVESNSLPPHQVRLSVALNRATPPIANEVDKNGSGHVQASNGTLQR